jgi:FHA domain
VKHSADVTPAQAGQESVALHAAVACWHRDQKCDIRIVNREVSRKHVQLEVDTDTGCVTLSSLGREPVSVNGEPAADPIELFTGDQIEVFAHTTGSFPTRSRR